MADSQGHIRFNPSDGPGGTVARVTLSNPGKLNVMTRAMWRELRQVFDAVAHNSRLRCVVVTGEGDSFCAGGDISEYPSFRFEPDSLRDFHEQDVWGGLSAMLACEVPLIAAIDGHCMGGGLEIVSCCDIRVAAEHTQFGAPIARLGFPMAPRELQLLLRTAGEATVREMLLQAAVLNADEMKARGFLSRVVPRAELLADISARTDRMAQLAPQAARMTKRMLRQMLDGCRDDEAAKFSEQNHASMQLNQANSAIESVVESAYDYASSVEHREGVQAFLGKRPPDFSSTFKG
ncbi:enoyl-CoA hydratase/isomerase family protein [Ottowia sp.]|uniref:enoyl-CoA hydratase/isomerase family protein n=1 Tax=Ottowia sp. TaxID=1898956 RepID=UPI003A83A548